MAVSKLRILVVEDDPGIRDHLANRLASYELVFAACQSDAFEQLESPDFDLVLLDLRLPITPAGMKLSNDAGIAILSQIRKRRLTKRGSAMLMPVVVMTAHGSEKLPSKIFMDHGASNYIAKPFGQEQELEHMITRALEGDAALVPAGTVVGSTVKLSFHPTDPVVRIESFTYRGAHHRLLCPLHEQFLRDRTAQLPDEDYGGIKGGDLAKKLKIEEPTLRRQIERFRRAVKKDFGTKLGRTLDDNDIIENTRTWNGYRLNPVVVRIIRWEPDRG